jgi:hypothetical protein
VTYHTIRAHKFDFANVARHSSSLSVRSRESSRHVHGVQGRGWSSHHGSRCGSEGKRGVAGQWWGREALGGHSRAYPFTGVEQVVAQPRRPAIDVVFTSMGR